jgi:hypothetical protein
MGTTVKIWHNDFDPFEQLLQAKHEIEQLQYQHQNMSQVINHQAQLIQNMSQHMIAIAEVVEELDKESQKRKRRKHVQ